MNNRGATGSLGGTLFDARGTAQEKIDESTSRKLYPFVRETVLKSTVFLLIIEINFIKCCHKIKKFFA